MMSVAGIGPFKSEGISKNGDMKMIVANWKCRLGAALRCLAKAVAATKSNASVVLCPSFTALDAVGRALSKSNVALGAQDVWQVVGAYTGEISPLHLGELGVAYVIVGHSERRALGETDAEVNKSDHRAVSRIDANHLRWRVCCRTSGREDAAGSRPSSQSRVENSAPCSRN